MEISKKAETEPINQNSPVTDRKDYAEFLDLAVHELDAPLRKLSVMIEKLVEKYENDQKEDARHYLQRAQSGLTHMRSTIEAIYQLSQLETDVMEISDCDTNQIITQLVSELKSLNKEKRLNENHRELPVLKANAKQMRQLFREILQNAIRFSGDKVDIQVEITCEDLPGDEKEQLKLSENKKYFKLVIRDNGIGFAKEDSEKIFKPFVRLNGRSAYPGNGMGLAICQKIVDNHHGIIYAEPNQPVGSSFLLILPQRMN